MLQINSRIVTLCILYEIIMYILKLSIPALYLCANMDILIANVGMLIANVDMPKVNVDMLIASVDMLI